MKNARLLLFDSDAYTASVLMDELARRGFGAARSVASTLELPPALEELPPDAVVFNYHTDQPDSLVVCSTIKLMAPNAAVIAIVSPGPALKVVRTWATQTRSIDVIIEKPLSDDRFFMALQDLLKARQSTRLLEQRAERLSNLVPEGAAEADAAGEAEMFEAAVLFTDIRGSSQAIRKMPPRDFFRLLNALLSEHSKLVRQFDGAVIKYTGDGVMAVFRGMGRSYLALRCALELARSGGNGELPFGVGVAEGLVLAGLIGDSNRDGQRRQYDLVGATVHLAARLCSMAGAAEVVTTRSTNAVAKLTVPPPREIGPVSIKGFGSAYECIAFDLSNLQRGA